jgi:hypothetical protein
VEGLREGQVGFETLGPKYASAWGVHLVGKLRWLAKQGNNSCWWLGRRWVVVSWVQAVIAVTSEVPLD